MDLFSSLLFFLQMKQTLINLKDHIDNGAVRYSTEQTCDKGDNSCTKTGS